MNATTEACDDTEWTNDELRALFAQYGFTATPLDNDQMNALRESGATITTAYNVGCDVYAGFVFEVPA